MSKKKESLSVSIKNKHYNDLILIVEQWENKKLNVSNEICESVLLKNNIENNTYLQKFMPTFNLIKQTLKNKNLDNLTYEEAFSTVLKNIFSIKINTEELGKFLEDDDYLLNINSYNETQNKQNKIKENKNTTPIATKNTQKEDLNNKVDNNEKNSNTNNNKEENNTSTDNILKWNIPKEPSFNEQLNAYTY